MPADPKATAPVEELRRRVWWERVDRAQKGRRHDREFADAAHDFLAGIHDYGDNAIHGAQHMFDGPGMTDAEEALYREYRDRLGKTAGAGPCPGDEGPTPALQRTPIPGLHQWAPDPD